MKQTYTITMDGAGSKRSMERINDGFTSLELLAICTITQTEILEQMKGIIRPDFITRKVVIPDSVARANDGSREESAAE